MSENFGFGNLQVGQRVKVKGNPGKENRFVALEISLKPGDDNVALEGKIQALEAQKNSLRLMNRDYVLSAGVELKGIQRQSLALKDFKVGQLVKIKGTYHAGNGGFTPTKVKLQESKGFNVEELQGDIEKIDAASRSFDVLGFTVVVGDKTEMEGFARSRQERHGERGGEPGRRRVRE